MYLGRKKRTGKDEPDRIDLLFKSLRSFRTPSSSSLILENQDFFMIQAQIESHQRKEELKIVSMDHEKHLYRLNDPIRRYSDFIGIVNAVLFLSG